MNPCQYYPRANADALRKEYVGKSISEIPTPAFVVDRSVVKRNCDKMLDKAAQLNCQFRAHVKTHKTNEGVKYQLAGRSDRVVVSTLMEAWAMKHEIERGEVKDLLYGLPVVKSRLGELQELSKIVDVKLMIDHVSQLDMLAEYAASTGTKWKFFIKVNMGTNRAGRVAGSTELEELIQHALRPQTRDALKLYGFYCHAGHSYASKTPEEASTFLLKEIDAANVAAQSALKIDSSLSLVISVGSTPTAHSFNLIKPSELGLVAELELHAGNYLFCDYQQLATQCINEDDVACTVIAEVASCYPGRNGHGEVLVNAGVIALAREPGPFPGFGKVITKGMEDWIVGRLSQEHGILVAQDSKKPAFPQVGERVRIIPQHSCITANAFSWYYIVDGNDKVVDIWAAWRGW